MLVQKSVIAIVIYGLGLITTLIIASETDDGVESSKTSDSCTSKVTCGSCIQAKGCAWCSKQDVTSQIDHCRNYTAMMEKFDDKISEIGEREERSAESQTWCPAENIIFPNSDGHALKDSPLISTNSKHGIDTVQIRPQKVKVKLRANEPFHLQLQYAQASDYPVDIYYLMDLSSSMADDKEKISKLGDTLSEKINELTSNFRIGFGSFVDKREMPFVNTADNMLKSPCKNPVTNEPCASPYSFINHMSLSSNTAQFNDVVYMYRISESLSHTKTTHQNKTNTNEVTEKPNAVIHILQQNNRNYLNKVKNARVSGNLDSPEGGLDALLQAIVCHKEIGWREKARRLIILSTDAEFHVAGDGKLAGIVEPNDGECHLENNSYTHAEILDYPSVSMINVKAQERDMIVIFAVNKEHIKIYEKLAERISGATATVISDDSSNIVDLVSYHYSKLVKSVKLSDNAPSHIEVQYFSSCLNDSSPEYATKECDGLRVGDTVNFTVSIKVLHCPTDKSDWYNKKFQIKPHGLIETLEFEFDILCECECEQITHNGSSTFCSNAGVLQCGVCVCDEGKIGNKCECNRGATGETDHEELKGCIPPGYPSDDEKSICSNQGTCKCGVCDCFVRDNPNEKFSGKYCECDNFSCLTNDDKLCSGPDHGTCKCGQCECNTEWKGPACECSKSNDTCIKPGSFRGKNAEVCSGNGDCECGKCYCHLKDDIRYSGIYCEECPTCKGHCWDLKDCVECKVFGSSSPNDLSIEECNKCNFTIIEVEKLPKDKSSDESESSIDEENGIVKKTCSLPDHADCTFFFQYWYDKDENLIVKAQKVKQCSDPVEVLGVILGVIGSIVLAGIILLLIWKVSTTIHDRREFARFEKERALAKWDAGENPIYHQATTSFENPTFGK